MSEIKTNKLTGTSTAGSILVTGEGNSTTTNLQQGLAKCWYTYNQDTPAVLGSFNASSITDEATGHHFVNFSNNMANANYSSPMKTAEYRERFESNDPIDKSTSRGVTVECFNSSGGLTDTHCGDMIIMGDLA
tara:strand:+ start:339 stop:737 length:399 start_codon:yes stop_codon:yes gene_type:complete